MKKLFTILWATLLIAGTCFAQQFPGVQGNPLPAARPGGIFYAPAFFWRGTVISGNTSTGASQSIIVAGNNSGGSGGLTLPDGTSISLQTVFNTLTPIIVDWGQGAQETVTPTSASVGTCPSGNLGIGGSQQCVTL